MMRIGLFVLLGAITLAGCTRDRTIPPQGGPAWKDVDNDGVPLGKGADECKYQAKLEAAAATGISKQEEVARDFFDSCMRQRGF